jgi:hypothetical protein
MKNNPKSESSIFDNNQFVGLNDIIQRIIPFLKYFNKFLTNLQKNLYTRDIN